jgi:hypothetical protein
MVAFRLSIPGTKETSGMSRALLAAALPLALAAALPAAAQDPGQPAPPPVIVVQGQQPKTQQPGKKSIRFAGDALTRYEWTHDLPTGVPEEVDMDRWRFQARPRLEATIGPVEGVVGGDFNYSEDENDASIDGVPRTLIRDNYRSRDARFDLYYGKLNLGPVSAQGGRFFMPLTLTEMIWDADLRPQGGSATVSVGGTGAASQTRFSATGIYATGSHVYEDQSILWGGGGEIRIGTGPSSSLSFAGSYLVFDDLDKLDPAIRRQNTRIDGLLAPQYHVVDLNARISSGGQMPMILLADYCWNTERETGNRGLWLSATLGAYDVSRAVVQYVYAKIDRDATVAAFNTDDYIWGTGWEGHRVDLSTATTRNSSLHAIAQWQRYKDSPDPVVAEHFVKRWRVEVRKTF